MAHHKTQLFIIFLTVFIDLLGFGLIIPIVPLYVKDFVTDPNTVGSIYGYLIASFSLMQFVFAPIWGRISDHVGRRPVIMITLFGTALTHFGFAFAPVLWLLFVTRIFTGIFSATVPTAMAFIADITTPEERAKGMGLIGAAFGLGFILGPAIGGFLSQYGHRVPLIAAGIFTLASFFFAHLKLKESLDANPIAQGNYRRFNLANLIRALKHPNLGILFGVFFIVTLSFANMETTFVLFTEEKFGFDSMTNGYLFAYIGIISATIQGGLIGRLSQRFGEKRIIVFGTLLLATGFVLFPLTQMLWDFLIALAMISIGIGLINPSIFSLVSKNATTDEQGGILGINQSFSSLGRIGGPLWAGFFFDTFGSAWPFWSAAIAIYLASVLSLRLFKQDLVQSAKVV